MGAARHDRVQRVGGPGGEQLLAGLDQRARRGAEQLGGPVAEDQAGGIGVVALGQLVAQVRGVQVRVAIQAAQGHERDRVDDPRMGELGPGRLGEVERLHARECLAPALG